MLGIYRRVKRENDRSPRGTPLRRLAARGLTARSSTKRSDSPAQVPVKPTPRPRPRSAPERQGDVAGPESRAACAPRRKTGPTLRHLDISASMRRHASGAVGLDVCMDVGDQKRPESRYSRTKTICFALKCSIPFRFAAFRAGFAPIFDPISPWRPARGDFVRQKWANRVPARALYFGVSK